MTPTGASVITCMEAQLDLELHSNAVDINNLRRFMQG